MMKRIKSFFLTVIFVSYIVTRTRLELAQTTEATRHRIISSGFRRPQTSGVMGSPHVQRVIWAIRWLRHKNHILVSTRSVFQELSGYTRILGW